MLLAAKFIPVIWENIDLKPKYTIALCKKEEPSWACQVLRLLEQTGDPMVALGLDLLYSYLFSRELKSKVLPQLFSFIFSIKDSFFLHLSV